MTDSNRATTYDLHAAPIVQPDLRAKFASWLRGLTFPITLELVADPDGTWVRTRGERLHGINSFSALTSYAFRWVPVTKELSAPDRVWVLDAQSDFPTMEETKCDPFLTWGDRLRDAAAAIDGEVALRFTVVTEDPELQSKLRSLSAYNYGTSVGVDDDEPNPWALRLKILRATMIIGAGLAGITAGAAVAGWLPWPIGVVTVLAGVVFFLIGLEGWRRWLRLRNVPREILEGLAAGPVLHTRLAVTMRREEGITNGDQILDEFFTRKAFPLSGPIDLVPVEPSVLDSTAVEAYTTPLTADDLAPVLAPAESGNPASTLHPDVQLAVPSPPPSRALREARFQIGHAIAGGERVGIDPDGHGLIVGGSGSGKSSLVYGLLEQLLEDDDPPGLFLIDPHVSLADAFLTAVHELPPERRKEAIQRLRIITPDQPEVVPLNLLAVPDFTWAGNTLVQVGNRIWTKYWGPRMQSALLGLFRLGQAWNMEHANQRLSLFHLVFAAFNTEWRDKATDYLPPASRMGSLALRALLGDYSGARGAWQQSWITEVLSPIISKLMALEFAPWLFHAMHQPDFVDLEQAIEEKAWIILRIPSRELGAEGSQLLSAAVYNIWEAAFRRTATPEKPIPYFVIVDEAQHIASGMQLETLLSEGTKFGARVFVLTQSLARMRQIEGFEQVVQALLANTSTQAFFSPDTDDKETIRDILSSKLRYGDMTLDLERLEFWLRARINGRWEPPVLTRGKPLAYAASSVVDSVIREVIAEHPSFYVYPEVGLRSAVRALVKMLPPKHRDLFDAAMGVNGDEDDTEADRSQMVDSETDDVPLMGRLFDDEEDSEGQDESVE